MTVFIVNMSGNDYDKAKEFGEEIVYLTRGFVNLRDDLETIRKKITNLINDSSPSDFLLLDGSKLLCALAVSLWKQKHGICNVLQWNPTHNVKKYESYKI